MASGDRFIPLNLADRMQWRLDETMRPILGRGNTLQLVLFLGDRVDASRLEETWRTLCKTYPVMTSRLVRRRRPPGWPGPKGFCWETNAFDTAPFRVHAIEGDDDAAVLSELPGMTASFPSPTQGPPIELHLFRRPTAPDVLCLQWAHTLMDGKAAEFLIDALDQIGDGKTPQPDEYGREIFRLIQKRSFREHGQKLKEVQRNEKVLENRPRRSLEPVRPLNEIDWTGRSQVLWFTEDETNRIRGPVKFGDGNISAKLIASAFRALLETAEHSDADREILLTEMPLNLRARGKNRPIFRNMMSRFVMWTEPDATTDREALVANITQQLRDQLFRGDEQTFLHLMRIAQWVPPVLRAAFRKYLRSGQSFGFSNMGTFGQPGGHWSEAPSVLGASIGHVQSFCVPATASGSFLCANLCGGRLSVSFSSIVGAVSVERANRFLENLKGDLLDGR